MRNFRDYFRKDCEDVNAWFDAGTFARWLDIDGHKVLGIMTRSRNTERIPGHEGIYETGAILRLKADDVKDVHAGQSLRVEGRMYVVNSHSITAGNVHRIELVSADG